MPNDDENAGRIAVSSRRGSLIAAAGCGKTEQIAQATAISDCKRLILTHTHAGVDAILSRLQKLKVPASKFHLSTIAGWCLQFCRSYLNKHGVREVRCRTRPRVEIFEKFGPVLRDVHGCIRSDTHHICGGQDRR